MNTILKLSVLSLALAAATPASAHIELFAATPNGASEAPPNSSLGTGTAYVTIDDDLATMRVQVTFAGLSGVTTASHIHCCTATPGVSTVGVATTVPTFPGFPSGVTSGTYDHTFSLADAATFNPTFVNGHGPLLGDAVAQFITGMEQGRAYLNIHTRLVPGGEIRGFLEAVPEPQTYAMFLGGLGVLGAVAARRRRG